jgi:hypothetical protein
MIVLLHISADQYRGTNDRFPPVEIPWLALGDGRNGAIVLKKSMAWLLTAIFESKSPAQQCFIAVLDNTTNTSFAVHRRPAFFNNIGHWFVVAGTPRWPSTGGARHRCCCQAGRLSGAAPHPRLVQRITGKPVDPKETTGRGIPGDFRNMK